MAAAGMMRVFRACSRSTEDRLLDSSPWINLRSADAINSLVVGKNAGNFVESAAFCENASRLHLLIQRFADEFPTRTSREFFCQRRELFARAGNLQGFSRHRPARPTHPIRSKGLSSEDKKITNCLIMLVTSTKGLCFSGRGVAAIGTPAPGLSIVLKHSNERVTRSSRLFDRCQQRQQLRQATQK